MNQDPAVIGVIRYATPPGEHSATLGYTLFLGRQHIPNVRSPKPDCTMTLARHSGMPDRGRTAASRQPGRTEPTATASPPSRTPTGTSPRNRHA